MTGQRPLRVACWLVAIGLGALQAWHTRQAMNPDGVVYLDMGDAYLRGDWPMALNTVWSPLYAWLLALTMHILQPSLYWEFPVVHLVNFALYVGAMGCFHLYLCNLLRYHRSRAAPPSGAGYVTLPDWAWLTLGYSLFVWSSLDLITLLVVTPDLCVAAGVYLAASLMLRIAAGSTRWSLFLLLGAVLGWGYLAKAAMFPLAFVFLGVSLCSVGHLRAAVPRVLAALIVFGLIASPFILALSQRTGRLTFGDSGKLNYAWMVQGVPQVHWQGDPPGHGTPTHPTRKLADAPALYEFGTPIGGTYPVRYDPAYWHDGLVVPFDLPQQLRVLWLSVLAYGGLFIRLQAGLIVGFLILFTCTQRPWRSVQQLTAQWALLLPALAALSLYAFVYVEPRYLGAFMVLFWLGVGSGVRVPDAPAAKHLVACVSAAIAVSLLLTVSLLTLRTLTASSGGWDVSWQVAEGLHRMGLQPGDQVACIGDPATAYWARLARVRIVAEIPLPEAADFWAADPDVRVHLLEKFTQTGAQVVVTEQVPGPARARGWQQIGQTNHYAYPLQR
jgi:hypothetical protein